MGRCWSGWIEHSGEKDLKFLSVKFLSVIESLSIMKLMKCFFVEVKNDHSIMKINPTILLNMINRRTTHLLERCSVTLGRKMPESSKSY